MVVAGFYVFVTIQHPGEDYTSMKRYLKSPDLVLIMLKKSINSWIHPLNQICGKISLAHAPPLHKISVYVQHY